MRTFWRNFCLALLVFNALLTLSSDAILPEPPERPGLRVQLALLEEGASQRLLPERPELPSNVGCAVAPRLAVCWERSEKMQHIKDINDLRK